MALVPSCVWRVSPELVIALDSRFGEPVDAYVNGSQTWLRDDGPAGEAIEWRLHPVPGYERPASVSHHELFGTVALALSMGDPPPAEPDQLWDGLEAFPAYSEEVEPVPLGVALTEVLGLPPEATGLVDHDRIADDWEHKRGEVSIFEALLSQLRIDRT